MDRNVEAAAQRTSLENRLWMLFGKAELITCGEFLACRDPITKGYICETPSIVDTSSETYSRDDSSIGRIMRMNRDPPLKPRDSRSVIDPPQLSKNTSFVDYTTPNEVSYYTSPVAPVDAKPEWWGPVAPITTKLDWLESNKTVPLTSPQQLPTTPSEWWKPEILSSARENILQDSKVTNVDETNINENPSNNYFPETIDLTTYDMDEYDYFGYTIEDAAPSISTVSQSILMKEEAPEFESESELSISGSNIEARSVLNNLEGIIDAPKGCEPPDDYSLKKKKSVLEPPGTIQPSHSMSIEALTKKSVMAATPRITNTGAASVEAIDLVHVSARSPASLQGGITYRKTFSPSRTIQEYQIPEEGPIVRRNNYPLSPSSTIPTLQSYQQTSFESSIPTEALNYLEPPQIQNYNKSPVRTYNKSPVRRRQYDESVSARAQTGVSIGVSDAATAANWRRASSSFVADPSSVGSIDDDTNTSCAIFAGQHENRIRRTGSNDSLGSVGKNVGTIFVTNNYSAATVTRIT